MSVLCGLAHVAKGLSPFLAAGVGAALLWPPGSVLGVLTPQEPEAGDRPFPPWGGSHVELFGLMNWGSFSLFTARSKAWFLYQLPVPCRIFGK